MKGTSQAQRRRKKHGKDASSDRRAADKTKRVDVKVMGPGGKMLVLKGITLKESDELTRRIREHNNK
jgi:hypothetical protein